MLNTICSEVRALEYSDIHAFCKDLNIDDMTIKFYLLALLMSYEYNEDKFRLDLQKKKNVICKIQLAQILAKLPRDQYADYFEMQDDGDAFLVMHDALRECLESLHVLYTNTAYHDLTVKEIMNDLRQTIQADYDIQSKRIYSQTEQISQDRVNELLEEYNSLFYQLKEYYSLFITSLVFGDTVRLSCIEPTIKTIWNAIEEGMTIDIKRPLFWLRDYKGNA
jgi:hypothetical protein